MGEAPFYVTGKIIVVNLYFDSNLILRCWLARPSHRLIPSSAIELARQQSHPVLFQHTIKYRHRPPVPKRTGSAHVLTLAMTLDPVP